MAGFKPKANCFSYKKALFLEKLEKSVDGNNAQKNSNTPEMVQNLRECKKFKFG